MIAWALLWCLYSSFVNSGQMFFGFVWEILLLEAGFLAIFLGNADTAPTLPAILLVRWLLFRLEVGAGLIKVRRDTAWRDLTALHYHHETQPIPNRFSRGFHHLPKWVHKCEVAGNHVAQLVLPFLLFLPQPVASIAGASIVLTQLWLMLSGNFAWLNLPTITLAFTAFDDSALARVLPFDAPSSPADPPPWFAVMVLAVTVMIGVISWRPVRNMLSRHQVMNASYNSLHIGNTYGLFARITRERFEIVIEGTDDPIIDADTVWKPYEFKAKPGDVARPPRQVAPYHLRLDWMMWFAALSPAYAEPWFVELIGRLLTNDPTVRKLVHINPFTDHPPTAVRALLFRYRFTTREQRKQTGAWWTRELVAEYLRPVSLRAAERAASPSRQLMPSGRVRRR